jgi:AcrR family transcriptional regulator
MFIKLCEEGDTVTGRPRSVSDEAVFEAVADVVTAVGPAKLTLAAVAQRAGLSAPALTQRFGSKRGLLVAFATSGADAVAVTFAAARDRARRRTRDRRPDPLAAVRDALASLAGPIATREGLANNLAFLQLDLTDAELREPAVTQSRAIRAQLTALLDEATATGHLAIDDTVILADTLYAIYCGALVTWAVDGTGELGPWLTERVDRILAPHKALSR